MSMINAGPRGFSLIFGKIQIVKSKSQKKTLFLKAVRVVFFNMKKIGSKRCHNAKGCRFLFFFKLMCSVMGTTDSTNDRAGGGKKKFEKNNTPQSLLLFASADFPL